MKTLIVVIIMAFTTLSTQHAIAQTGSVNEKKDQEIKAMLCRKWKLTHYESEGRQFPVPSEMGASYLTFKADGSFTEVEEGKSFPGTWTYDHKTMTLTTDDKDGQETHKIVTITNERLILKSKFEDMTMNLIMTSVKNEK